MGILCLMSVITQPFIPCPPPFSTLNANLLYFRYFLISVYIWWCSLQREGVLSNSSFVVGDLDEFFAIESHSTPPSNSFSGILFLYPYSIYISFFHKWKCPPPYYDRVQLTKSHVIVTIHLLVLCFDDINRYLRFCNLSSIDIARSEVPPRQESEQPRGGREVQGDQRGLRSAQR